MRVINLKTEAFNTKQVCALTSITKKQVIHWDRQGLVRPSIRPASGRGSRRLYSYPDLLALKVVKGLRDQGLSLQRVRKCVLFLRAHMPDISRPLNFCQLITDGQTAYLVENEKTLLDTVTRPGQRAFLQLIDLAVFDRELRQRVVKLTANRIETVTVGEYAYQVEIEADEEDGGYVATVAGLPGCITNGDSLEDVLENIQDAMQCWLEAHEALGEQGINVRIHKNARRRRVRA